MIEMIIVLALILISAGAAVWVTVQYDTPTTDDALTLRYRNHANDTEDK